MRHALLLPLVLLLGAPFARADGMLDPAFGNGGRVITAFPPPPPPFTASEGVAALVVLPDGRAVAAGRASTEPTTPGIGVARYLPSGALDTTFSLDGLVQLDCPSFGLGTGAVSVLFQPDGRLVLVDTCPASQFRVVRLNADGSLDASFGTGGQVLTSVAGFGSARAGLLQPDGRILVVGSVTPASGGLPSPIAARYNADGSLDASFGTAGQVTLPLAQEFVVGGAALQTDGKPMIAGTYGAFSGSGDFGLVRLLPNGAPDPSFDGDGLAVASVAGNDVGLSVVLLPDGRSVVAGSHDGDFALARFQPNGSLDPTFGTGGFTSGSFGAPVIPDEAIRLPNGKLMLAGYTNDSGAAGDMLMARFHADGPLDTAFGDAGFLRTDFNGSLDVCQAVTLAGPDRVLAAGASCQGVDCDFALARYIATTPVELLAIEIE